MNEKVRRALERIDSLDDSFAEQMQDPEWRAAYEALAPGFQIARLRNLRGLSQAELALRVGTQQPAIARLESGRATPNLDFLKRVAEALGARVDVQVRPLEELAAPS